WVRVLVCARSRLLWTSSLRWGGAAPPAIARRVADGVAPSPSSSAAAVFFRKDAHRSSTPALYGPADRRHQADGGAEAFREGGSRTLRAPVFERAAQLVGERAEALG